MMASPQNDWIIGRHCIGEPRIRMICVPQAGAGAGAFSGWRGHLPPGVEMAPVELPGRGTREREALPSGIDALATALFEGLRAEFDMPYVLFGHSLGGVLTYEVARRVQDGGLRAPLAVVISGSRAPQVPSLRTMSSADDERLLAWMVADGGLRPELLEHPAFLATIMRAVRTDLVYAESYLVPDPPPLRFPLHVLGGADDAITPPEQLPRWQRCAAAEFSATLLPGGHSFPHTDPAALLAVLRDLRALPAQAVPV